MCSPDLERWAIFHQSPLRDRSLVTGVKQSTRFIYLFLAYLRTLGIAKVIERQMTRWCVNRRNGKYESILGIGISLSLALVDGKTAYVTTAGLRAVICQLKSTKYAMLPTDSDVRLLDKKKSRVLIPYTYMTQHTQHKHCSISTLQFQADLFDVRTTNQIYLYIKNSIFLTLRLCTIYSTTRAGTTCIHIRTMNNSMITNIRHVKVLI